MKDCLIVFAKEPEVGKVKTRLQGYLSKDMCVKLYQAFLKDTLELVRAIKCFDKVLAYESSIAEPRYLKTIAKDFLFYRQKGRNLGEKMHDAFKFAKRINCDKTVIIGSDIPNLPLSYVEEAYRRLDRSDIVVGPSYDGGYYLIGVKKLCVGIFRDVKWSSETVLEKTIKNSQKLNKKIAILHKWYDVDDSAGLLRLKSDLKKEKKFAPWTRKLLKI